MKLRKEIGSEFWDVPIGTDDNGLFPENTEWFLSGRIALYAIIEDILKTKIIRSVSMPDWCCESMIIPFLQKNIQVEFYQCFCPIDSIKTDAILLMDYFGYTQKSFLQDYKGIVIRDITHSIFSKNYTDADYYFGSLRKWAGFWTGGYAWGFKNKINYDMDNLSYCALREKAMQEKKDYINFVLDNKDYLHKFEEAENQLNNLSIIKGNPRDIELARKLDYQIIKEQRRKNAKILLNDLSDLTIFKSIGEADCPMFVPIKHKKRNELRKFLIDNNIYCPIHWPITENHKISTKTQTIINEELSLICDQRYNEDDMRHIIEVIRIFEGK